MQTQSLRIHEMPDWMADLLIAGLLDYRRGIPYAIWKPDLWRRGHKWGAQLTRDKSVEKTSSALAPTSPLSPKASTSFPMHTTRAPACGASTMTSSASVVTRTKSEAA